MKHSEIRQTIVETASDLFYKKGYNLTGINEIIKEAGVAKATLYSHFRSKDDICVAYLRHKNDTFLEEIKAYALKSPKGKSQLLALFNFLKNFFKDKGFNGCWCIRTVAEIPREKEDIRKEIQHQKNQFIQLINHLTETNFPNRSAKENKALAKRIYLLYEGAVAESHLHQSKWPIDSAKELCELVLKEHFFSS